MPTASPAPEVLVFDVNETLSDMAGMRSRLASVGVAPTAFRPWFAGVLRDGFALTAAGGYADLADVARDGLRALTEGTEGPALTDDAIEHVVAGFSELDVHPEVPAGVRALHGARFRLITMTNGSAAVTEALLERAGLRDHFDLLLDVRGPRCWKPAPEAYRYAVDAADVAPADAMLVAVHPWDVDGAVRAGLRGAWIRRGTPPAAYPSAMMPPTLAAGDLVDVAHLLARGGQSA
ncbi:haloacid dehalogenase, type II [Brachybacterium sp. P6-10-X1]|uniref:haloacid dehalogenase type II n=1 Tax=Brachybacterium sp. P6-10-X1 TaxID=1903186 RepID=UPI0009717889|nr:haloacid dehalogenase type II [Brachybacterium sp. P6-10-X1]APX32367.1 haloacid dehalogenase, type II [Brachybacterium sp. P6-10-X1]